MVQIAGACPVRMRIVHRGETDYNKAVEKLICGLLVAAGNLTRN